MVEMEVRKVTKGRESNMVAFDFERTPITQIADYIIITASKNKASDIHFDPREDGMMVRFRIDGDLQDYTYIPKLYERNLTTRLKLLANMNITESRLPQDGAIKGEFGGKYLDMRVSSLPLNTGEKIVIRILDYSRSLEGIDKLDFNQTNLSKLKRMMAVPNGIILVTGATGSGKSTTVYSMLQELNKPEINIITVEDPIEMNIEGLNQVQINAEIGMTFAAALRSILRQDPNIILIGEIRDSETAQIAVRASITGHLILSTIHTNNSLSTIERLLDMDVERYLMSTALTGIISQRLAKKLCPHCRIERPTTKYERKVFKKFMNRDIEKIYDINPTGCEHCRKGYSGRIAIHEVLELDDDIRYAISNNKLSKEELSTMVYGDKTITMLQDALGKAISGLTTFEEVYRVIELESDPEDDTAYLTKAIDDVPETETTTTDQAKENLASKMVQPQVTLLTPEQARLQAETANQKLQEQTKNEPKITDLIQKPQEARLVITNPDLKPTIISQTQQLDANKSPAPAPTSASAVTSTSQPTKKFENVIPELNIKIKTDKTQINAPSIEESPHIKEENTFSEKDKVTTIDLNKINESTDLKKEDNIINNPLKPTVKPIETNKRKKTSENTEPIIIGTMDIQKEPIIPITPTTATTTTEKKESKVLPVVNTETKSTTTTPSTVTTKETISTPIKPMITTTSTTEIKSPAPTTNITPINEAAKTETKKSIATNIDRKTSDNFTITENKENKNNETNKEHTPVATSVIAKDKTKEEQVHPTIQKTPTEKVFELPIIKNNTTKKTQEKITSTTSNTEKKTGIIPTINQEAKKSNITSPSTIQNTTKTIQTASTIDIPTKPVIPITSSTKEKITGTTNNTEKKTGVIPTINQEPKETSIISPSTIQNTTKTIQTASTTNTEPKSIVSTTNITPINEAAKTETKNSIATNIDKKISDNFNITENKENKDNETNKEHTPVATSVIAKDKIKEEQVHSIIQKTPAEKAFKLPAIKNNTTIKTEEKTEQEPKAFITEIKRTPTIEKKKEETSPNKSFITEIKQALVTQKAKENNLDVDDKTKEKKLEVTDKTKEKKLEVTDKTKEKKLEVTDKTKEKVLEVINKDKEKELEVADKTKEKILGVINKDKEKELKVADKTKEKEIHNRSFITEMKNKETATIANEKVTEQKPENSLKKIDISTIKSNKINKKTDSNSTIKNNTEISTNSKVNIFKEVSQQEKKTPLIKKIENESNSDSNNELPILGED